MLRTAWKFVLYIIFIQFLLIDGQAQTATYHLHHEFSTELGVFYYMKTNGPDQASVAKSSINLKNRPPGEYDITSWKTLAGVPNLGGTIPAGATITFTLWMKKSSNAGIMFPLAKLRLNGPTGTIICTVTGSTALTTTLTKYTLTGATTSPIPMTTADRFFLTVGINLTQGPGNRNLQGEVHIEGTLNGNTDSQIVVPLPAPPAISSLSPSSGTIGTSVTVNGSNFGATQGTSTITFNCVAATPTTWTDTSIVAPVPAGATTGAVVVTVSGVVSNGVAFTVLPTGGISGAVTRTSDGAALSGATVEVLQSGAIIASTTTATNGTYSFNGVIAGIYDVRISSDGYLPKLRIGIAVTGSSTSTVDAALSKPGTISGKVTQSDGTTPIIGAAVEVSLSTAIGGATTTNATGDYSIGGFNPGTYTVQSSAIGYKTQIGVTQLVRR